MSRIGDREQKYRRPAAWLYYLITSVIGLLVKVMFSVRIHRDPRLRGIKGPMIILGNHPSLLDPPILAMTFFTKRIHYLTTHKFFRKPWSRWILNTVAAIPKIQFRADMQATKSMLRVIRNGGWLAIYPEGQRSLDGSWQTIDEAIAKLVKKTGCPVAVVREHGAHLSWPRWSKSGPRFGRIEVSARLLLTAEDLATMDLATIQTRIEKALKFNDYGWQRKRHYRFLSLAPARGLHNLCHQCPACGQMLAMRSSRFHLTCRFCGNQARMDRYAMLLPAVRDMNLSKRLKILPDPYRWHQWQMGEMAKRLQQPDFLLEFAATAELPAADGIITAAGHGLLRLTGEQLCFESTETGPGLLKICFQLADKTGMNARFGSHIELVRGDLVYRFIPDEGQAVIIITDAILTKQAANDNNSI